jgi:endonuclease III
MTKRVRYSEKEQRHRVSRILAGFDRRYPDAKCALEHRNALELLIATILSAQCTDERVNQVTRELFRKYRSPQDYISVAPEVLQEDIRPTGFFRNKTKSVQGACRMILERFGGKVPDEMDDLLQLPGVARKTANVVLGVVYGKAEGVVVDTHVYRVSRRLELTAAETPEKIEQDLMALIPRERWISFSHQTILHGRQTCKARKPLCAVCPVETDCHSRDKTFASQPSVQSPSARKKRTT